MIYVSYDGNGTIERIHYKPFDPVEGMGKEQAELEAAGILVDALPQANTPDGQVAELRVNVETKELYYKYNQLPPTQASEIEQLKSKNTLLEAQNNALSERADFIEDVVAEMAAQVYQ